MQNELLGHCSLSSRSNQSWTAGGRVCRVTQVYLPSGRQCPSAPHCLLADTRAFLGGGGGEVQDHQVSQLVHALHTTEDALFVPKGSLQTKAGVEII